MFSGFGLIALIGGGVAFTVLAFVIAIMFRRVVRPNEVHIVQSSKGTLAYGMSQFVEDEDAERLDNGNAYYEWPTAIPKFGVQVVKLPLAVFDEQLDSYDAYDVGKVPFIVDIVAFFRIDKPSIAAKRIENLKELQSQLKSILQGAVRTVLAQHDIEQIMEDRSTFGDLFTSLTKDQLAAWGVVNVKNIELMDIRDPLDGSSKTVQNIMAKKQSKIDAESRTEVAINNKSAEVAEIAANQEVAIRDQHAQELVGQRTAEKDKAVGIANELAQQEIKTQAKETMTRDMAVREVEAVRTAEITKEQQLVVAAQQKETSIIKADGIKQEQVIKAEGLRVETETVAAGVLVQQTKEAEGTLAIGTAEAEAAKLLELANVDPQITLAKEIGDNEGYQTYLIQIRNVEATERIGVENAKALQQAGIKVIANTGTTIGDGVSSVSDLFTAQGGLAIGSTVEGLANTPGGKAVLTALGVDIEDGTLTATPQSGPGNGAAA